MLGSRLVFNFLLNGIWQIPLIAAIAWLAAGAIRRGPASHRHALWIAALIAAILVPLAGLRTASSTGARLIIPFDATPLTATASRAAAPPTTPSAAASLPSPRTIDYAPVAAGALLSFFIGWSLFGAARLAWAYRNASHLRAQSCACELPEPAARAWARAGAALDSSRVELRWSSVVASPLMIGVIHKTIVLPQAMLAETSEDVLTTALGHELGHAVRNDFAWNLFAEILALPISMHPAAHFLLRRIRETREVACDELVTRCLIAPHDYARSMVAIASQFAAAIQPSCSLGVFDGNIFEERIRRLLASPTRLRYPRLCLAASLGVLAIAAVLASGYAISARAQEPSAGPASAAEIPQLRRAVDRDPNNIPLRLQLAHSLALQGFSGDDGSYVDLARNEYLQVLARDPANREALRGLMFDALGARKFADARRWAGQLLTLDAHQGGPLYVTGYTAWVLAYPDVAKARAQAGQAATDQSIIPDPATRAALQSKYAAQIDDGLKSLETAVALDPDYADAMSYLNLLLRLKAALADSPVENAGLIAQANEWLPRALAAGKRAEQKPPVYGLDRPLLPPPPPPPPPPPGQDNDDQLFVDDHAAIRTGPTAKREDQYWQVAGAIPMTVRELRQSLESHGYEPETEIVEMEGSPDRFAYILVGPYKAPAMPQAKASLEAAGFRVVQKW